VSQFSTHILVDIVINYKIDYTPVTSYKYAS